ncbi:hypothetical protein NDU88_000960 [Pleurodeles waltl]|uniref:Heat shock factor-binding protein 1-like protein 1 n=1 Tax=Pleurodeles waltl TaxID=8319 RepID=A0AAV7KQT6_PLEWA|nr:hypothetical protein NDU88_000960 [Pleurodeles waltl]
MCGGPEARAVTHKRGARRYDQGPEAAALARGPGEKGDAEEDSGAPVTKGFLTSLFDSLRMDLQELRKDISQEMRDLRADITSLGERVLSMEDNKISRGEEVEQL